MHTLKILLGLAIFLSSLGGVGGGLFAQTGTISGKLKQDDGQPAIGARIFVYTTNGEEIVGDANTADDNENMGKFKTNAIPVGVYDLHIKYEGYKRMIIKNVPVETDKSTEINLRLELIEPNEPEEIINSYKVLFPKIVQPSLLPTPAEEPKKSREK